MNQQLIKLTLLALIFLTMFFSGCKSHKKMAAITLPNAQQQNASAPKETKPSATEAEEQGKFNAMKEETYKGRLLQYFDAIANASTVVSANSSIDEALTLFASPQAPVLIVISNEGAQKDYDRPTSIKAYLNYLKDQKKNINAIEHLKLDEFGKIMEVELQKNNQIK